MNDFKKRVLVTAVIAGLGMIGYLMNSQQAVAQGPPGGLAVNIVNPVPVPVTGSVTSTVTGAVGVTGTVGLASGASVHVNNTVTSPALTLDISKSASQHVVLNCHFDRLGSFCFSPPNLTPYIVPAGQNLVLTSVDISEFDASVPIFIGFSSASGVGRLGRWDIPADSVTHSFQYPSGIVFPAGYLFDNSKVEFSNPAGPNGGANAIMHGFLTPL
jgi:hypothetical protein